MLAEALEAFARAVRPTSALGLWLVKIPMTPTRAFETLRERCSAEVDRRPMIIRNALLHEDLFEFGEARVREVSSKTCVEP